MGLRKKEGADGESPGPKRWGQDCPEGGGAEGEEGSVEVLVSAVRAGVRRGVPASCLGRAGGCCFW